jgi:Skp family chaperone for outer membrane proteins
MKHLTTIAIILGALAILRITEAIAVVDDTATLGPVDAISLAGKDGDLSLRNDDGHLAWGEEATSRALSTAFVHVGRALEPLMAADHFVEARQDLNDELNPISEELEEIMQELWEEGKSMSPDDPDADDFRQRYEQTYAELQEFQKRANAARAALAAEQMQEAYSEVLAAVNVVADRLHIDLVLRFIPPDEPIEPGPPNAITAQIRLRSALRLPDELDITDDVLAELGHDTE